MVVAVRLPIGEEAAAVVVVEEEVVVAARLTIADLIRRVMMSG